MHVLSALITVSAGILEGKVLLPVNMHFVLLMLSSSPFLLKKKKLLRVCSVLCKRSAKFSIESKVMNYVSSAYCIRKQLCTCVARSLIVLSSNFSFELLIIFVKAVAFDKFVLKLFLCWVLLIIVRVQGS